MTIARLAALLVAGALVAIGCGEDRGASSTSTSTTAGSSSGGQEIEVGLNEWKVTVEAPSVGKGDVKFEADNEGKTPHELVVVKSDTKAGDLKVEGGKAKIDGETLGTASNVGPGEHKDVEVELEAGHYILLCNLPGHYEQGMSTDLDVQ